MFEPDENLIQTFTLIKKFKERYDDEIVKLPYHLNIIDELHANENAHSRILVKLLQYNKNTDSSFTILRSFIDFFYNSSIQNFPHTIVEPKITAEKMRIDVLIFGKNNEYGIIIENKIHGAKDQGNQIINYIKKLKDKGIKEKDIYIIYLTKSGGSPSEDSFPSDKKIKFGNRYLELSYRSGILEWLNKLEKDDTIFTDDSEEFFLNSALEQYIDHLEGLFHMRPREIKMDNNILDYINKQLELVEDKHIKNIEIINNQLKNLSKINKYMEITKKINYLKYWCKKLNDETDNKYKFENNFNQYNGYPKVAVMFDYISNKSKSSFAVVIEFSESEPEPYFGLSTHFTNKDEKQNDDVKNFITLKINNIFSESEKNSRSKWYGKKKSEIEKVYDEFRNLLQIIEININKDL